MGINDVIDAVILELQEIFGDNYTYYPENVGQAMKLPCFFVQFVAGNEKALVGKRYASKSHFVIHGHVENDGNQKAALNNMATLLYNVEYIKLSNGDLIRIEEKDTKVENNEVFMDFYVNVHLIKTKQEEIINMEKMNMNGGIKADA